MGSFGIGGAGLDVDFLVQQILFVERGPVRLLEQQDARFNAQAAAFRDISDKLLTLVDAINALKDFTGTFNSKLATSSDTSILTAFADASAQVGNHVIVVTNLATTSSYFTNALADGDTTFSTGQFDLTVGTGSPTTITVTAGVNDTLNTLAADINSQGLGVTASVITDSNGARLSIVSNTSGAAGDLTVANDTTGLVFNKGNTGVDASLTVDGVPISSASNTISTVIPGVTFTLLNSSGGSQTLTIEQDEEKAREAVDEFVAAYNAVIQTINTQFTFNPVTEQGGVLSGDSSLRFVQSSILKDAVFSISGNNGIVNLATIGIDIANDGTLSVNSTELDNVLASNFEDVQTLITSFAQNFSTDLDNLTDSIDGPLNIALKGISRNQSDIADTIRSFEARLELRQQSLIEKFSRIDILLRQLPVLLAQINNQLGVLS